MDTPSQVFFSIVIPAHNEEEVIETTCEAIVAAFAANQLSDYEILVVNDNSRDRTKEILQSLAARHPALRHIDNDPPNGFGFAIRRGLDHYRGEVVTIVMADLSDAPEDIVSYYRKMREGHECVFGSRFMHGSRVVDYPPLKLVLNRLANWFVQALFLVGHNDITNPFKCYRREVIDGIRPIIANHFNLEVELPLKAIVRGYRWVKVPISWTNRDGGESKFKIGQLFGRYLYIVGCVFLERLLVGKDYRRRDQPRATAGS